MMAFTSSCTLVRGNECTFVLFLKIFTLLFMAFVPPSRDTVPTLAVIVWAHPQ